MPEKPPLGMLDSLPLRSHRAEPHIWADYIELLCLVSMDREVSKADVLDRISERQDLGEIEDVSIEQSALNSTFSLDSELPDQYATYDDDADFLLGESSDQPVVDAYAGVPSTDRLEAYASAWFEILHYRARIFDSFYPFEIRSNSIACRPNIGGDPQQRLYLFLLLSSCLKYVQKQSKHFTDWFEVVSLIALKSMLPKRGKVSFVGSNSLNKGPYRGKAWNKLEVLSREIGDPISKKAEISRHELQDTGDRGLDIMGRVSFGDTAEGKLVLFGQCGCGKDWSEKQLEPHVANWRGYMEFSVPPSSIIFIPYCYRGADGGWHRRLTIKESLLVDRPRLVHLLRTKLTIIERIDPYRDVLARVLEYSEPLV